MEEKSRNSLKLDIKDVAGTNEVKEVYKVIPEDSLILATGDGEPENAKIDTNLKEVKMVQNGDRINDGADERMLGAGDDKILIAAKKDEVKFISGDQKNGDAKIDIGVVNNKAFTGMSKDELMKYANDPFWVRLRWIFFILFWAVWAAMLLGAILIIIHAPKCAAPKALVWWKQGPLLKFKNVDDVSLKDVVQAQKFQATGVIYELPAEETYAVKIPAVEDKIKKLVHSYHDTGINVILDLTANYVSKNSTFFQDAINDKTKTKRSVFIWREDTSVPNNWLSKVNGSAWHTVEKNNFVLSQFGDDKFDLNMNNTIVKEELFEVFKHLMGLGVMGFRLSNAKYFLVNGELKNEEPNTNPKFFMDDYGFWTHSQTTFQEGLGDLLKEYKSVVFNVSCDAFLSVTEDLIRPEVFQVEHGEFGIDLPLLGRFTQFKDDLSKTSHIISELNNTFNIVGKSWVQWQYDLESAGKLDYSSYNMFLMLLRGVPVIEGNSESLGNISLSQLEQMRSSASFMHGNFELYHSGNIVAYSRIKSGNPGFFVLLNPTEFFETGNFTATGLPEKMTVDLLSDNYNSTGTDIAIKSKIETEAIRMSPYSAAVLTYVPVK